MYKSQEVFKDELTHHGIINQNPDGTLTSEGRIRYINKSYKKLKTANKAYKIADKISNMDSKTKKSAIKTTSKVMDTLIRSAIVGGVANAFSTAIAEDLGEKAVNAYTNTATKVLRKYADNLVSTIDMNVNLDNY